ncbi:hypothetical protein [Sulfuracidifex metallicus]|uniref:Uncharacterized protein n=1 Tax=Sulfuracidifex metallicus DSM 6482 = JCM 9184 TaxID=523847 RepID=A0A6A9QTE3_SULME|nr:hypothetical protein [Sulfuracidifex metallicus]MUN29033.1 hypothetical protein [Sulfuracidifex metallicus DSM 6482 = JCM 9184]
MNNMMRKGISGILGALILLIVLMGSLTLVFVVQRQESSIFIGQQQTMLQSLSSSPISEIYSPNGQPELMSDSGNPVYITHLILPNGEILNEDFTVTSIPIPVSKLESGYPWFVVVTNEGADYNVSDLTFPPSDPSNYEVTGISEAIKVPQPPLNAPVTKDLEYLSLNSTVFYEYVLPQLLSLPFHNDKWVQPQLHNINGVSVGGLSNTTLIYEFPPSNLSFDIVTDYYTLQGAPDSNFGIVLSTASNSPNYYLEYFYLNSISKDEGCLYWNQIYPSGKSYSSTYMITQVKDPLQENGLTLYNFQLIKISGSWYLKISSNGNVGVNYCGVPLTGFPLAFNLEDYPSTLLVKLTSSPIYEVYVIIPQHSSAMYALSE